MYDTSIDKRARRKALIVLLATVGFVLTTASTAFAVTPVNVYRFCNVSNGSHFYTASDAERLSVVRTLYGTYSYEGIAWTIDAASPAATQPLHRFYNFRNGTHFYTASEAEKNNIIATLGGTYRYEGVAYYVSLSIGTPVYRFYRPNPGCHFYTTSVAERDSIVATLKGIYNYEGVAFYVPTAPAAYVTDDDRYAAGIMTEWVNNYGFTLDGTWLGDLSSPYLITYYLRNNLGGANWVSTYAWGDSDAWELDWKSATLGGNDYRLADNVDLAAFAGHGLGRNFVMNNAHNDHYAAIADMRLGDRDLEWLLAFTCRFLEGSKDQLGTMMNGLHLANGYSTKMFVDPGSGSRFAAWANAPYGVRVAWYRQAYETQPNTLDTGAHIIARTFGHVNNVNDYLWGYGNAGRDPAPYSPANAGSYVFWDYDVYGY